MSTLHIVHAYHRRYAGRHHARLDCIGCRGSIATGAKVLLESRPIGKADRRPNVWHPECFAGPSRDDALRRHLTEHESLPSFLLPQWREWEQEVCTNCGLGLNRYCLPICTQLTRREDGD